MTDNEKLPTREEISDSDDERLRPPLSNNTGSPTSSAAARAKVTVAQAQDEHVTEGTDSDERGAHSKSNAAAQQLAAVEEIIGSNNEHNSMHSAEETEIAHNSEAVNNASMHRSVAEDIRPGAFHIYPNGLPAAPSPEAIASSSNSGVVDAESQALEDSNNRHIHVITEAYAVEEVDGLSNANEVPTILGVEKKCLYLMALVMFVLLLITLGTILGTFIPRINDDDGSVADQTRKPTIIVLTPEELTKKRQILVNALSPLALAGQEVFDLDGSANYSAHRTQALEWLMNDIPDYVSLTTESIFGYYQEWKIQQRYIMALIYFSTNGTGWNNQLHFLSELDECLWIMDFKIGIQNVPYGLGCDPEGRIIGIDLKVNNLVGTIPDEVSFLSKSLTMISLGSNSISSTIPSSFEELQELTILTLSWNCLTGTIPDNLYKLESLEIVKLTGNNHLSGNLNGFCEEDKGLRENISYLVADCGNCPWGVGDKALIKCDCCSCCDADSFRCCNTNGMYTVKSVSGANL